MAGKAAHVTMLQRSPTYIMPVPSKDTFANTAKKVLGAKRGYALARRKNIVKQRAIYQFCQNFPGPARKLIRHLNAKQLPEGYPVDEHFNPSYNPWDQRLCAVPDGDLFKAIGDGSASVVTDRIATFTETGIELESGRHLDADIIVTATGLNLQMFGGVSLSVDGEPVDFAKTFAYKGMMLSGVPNFAFAVRLHELVLDAEGRAAVRALLPAADPHGRQRLRHRASRDRRPGDGDPAAAGLLRRIRAACAAPDAQAGYGAPWMMSSNYYADVKLLRGESVVDPNLRFGASRQIAAASAVAVTA